MMIKKISQSVRAKGTLIAIGILFFACFVTFVVSSLVFLLFFEKNLTIEEAHVVYSELMTVALVFCVVIGSWLLFYAMKLISRPILEISKAAEEVSRGNFSVKVNYRSNDEIGLLAENFNLMTDELSSMEYLRKDFITNVSHEFKTPIASIQGFAEMLQDKALTPEAFEQYTNIIVSEARRLNQLSSNMLRLSKLDNQYILEEAKLFSLDEQIRKTIVLLEEKWSQKKIALSIDLEKIDYIGDEALTQQVWLNLIENAIKFSNINGTISITAKNSKDGIEVIIEDNGIGLSEADQKRVFEKFFQADQSRAQMGNGLGLAIVQKIVEINKGSIELSSEQNIGTKMTIKLPVKDSVFQGKSGQ